MKTKILFVSLLCALISVKSFSQAEGERYYYSLNKKIFLRKIDDKMIVSFQRNSAVDVKTRISSEKIVWQNDSIYILNIGNDRQKTLKSDLLQTKGVKSVHPMYAACGVEVGMTDEIVMKFHKDVSQQQIDEIHRKYQVRVKKTTDLYQVVTVPPNADALEIANQYQLSGLVEYSCPDFLVKAEKHQTIPTDPYFVNQFYLHNTGQSTIKSIRYIPVPDTIRRSGTPGADIRAPEAWDITKGSSDIIIAVIDEGVTFDHPDLPESRLVWLKGSNFGGGDTDDPYPYPTDNHNHGNACAGIIAASHNDEGIAGIAPNCKIMPVRLVLEYNNFSLYAEAITFAKNNGADILSCSWGFENYPNFPYNPKDRIPSPNLFPSITNAIKDATENGRGGKGCVVVFSAGNFANHAAGDPGFIGFPANVQIPGVLTVGASDRYDQQANYSPTSHPYKYFTQQGYYLIDINVDIVAPSSRVGFCTDSMAMKEGGEIWTIDIPGPTGDNPVGVSAYCPYPNNSSSLLPYFPDEDFPIWSLHYDAYTGYFGGTSAAAPQVAGVAALILSVNPNLTQQEVSDIIKLSARKTKEHTYTYQPSPILWDEKWNAQMGYGVLDAQAAVLQAQGYYTFFHHTMRSFVSPEDNDDKEISTCKEVLIQDVDLQGDVKFTVESGKRIVIKPPFKANPFGSNAAKFYAGINQNLCKSPKLQSSPPPEAQRASPAPTGIIQPVVREAFLAQNAPNPAREQTVIPYYIPESFHSASLLFTTVKGVRVKHIPIHKGGEGHATVSVSELPPGIYLYSLLVDGRVVATKRMHVLR